MLSHGRLLLIEIKSCGSWVDGVAGLDLVLSLLHLRDYSSPYVLFYGPTTMENSLGFVFLIRPRRVFRDGRLVACWSSWFLTLKSFLCLFRPVLRLAESRSGHCVSVPWLRLLSHRTARAVTSSSGPKYASRFVHAHVHLFPRRVTDF